MSQNKIKFCVYCRNIELQTRDNKACLICETDHEMLTCEWLQMLDIVHSFTLYFQEQLVKVCRLFKDSLDHPYEYIFYIFRWLKVKPIVEKMD